MNTVQISVGVAGALLLLFRNRQQLLALLPKRKPAEAISTGITCEQAIGHLLQLKAYAEHHQLTNVLERIPELTADLVRSEFEPAIAPRATSKSKR